MALAEREIIAGQIRNAYIEPRPVRWNQERYHEMGRLGWFQDRKVELVDGAILEMSPMSDIHAQVILTVSDLFADIFRPDNTVSVQLPLNLSDLSEPEPDIAVLAGRPKDYPKKPQTALLVVEVSASSLAIDRRKAVLYAQAGIPECWILNIDNATVEVYRQPNGERDIPGSGSYAEWLLLKPVDSISPLAAPHVSILASDLLP